MFRSNRRIVFRVAVAVVAIYAVLSIVLLLAVRTEGYVPERISAAIVLGVASIMGPPVLLAEGLAAAPSVLVYLTIIGACLALSRHLWRRYPESEAFAVPIMAAVFVWVAVPFLTVLVAFV